MIHRGDRSVKYENVEVKVVLLVLGGSINQPKANSSEASSFLVEPSTKSFAS